MNDSVSSLTGLSKFAGWMLVPLLFAGCASAGGDGKRDRSSGMVVGKVWQWEALVTPVETIEAPDPERYTFELMPDGKVRARFDCNRGGGTYRIADGQLSFGSMVSTRMGCAQGSLGERFGQELSRVTTFFLENGQLYLGLPADAGTMRFRVGGKAPGR